MNVLLLADTHLRDGQGAMLVDKLGSHLEAADAIIHAGDVTHASVLEALEEFAPVRAVLGNNDHGMALPERFVVEFDGCEIAAVHDSGPADGRTARLRRWFPHADVVVFGHSHIPWHQVDVRTADGHAQHHINPGSATQRRSSPNHTAALLRLHDGVVSDVTHIVLP
jgi:putative phosphoesterase